ncbi:MAG TPA: farnesyl diphosphate synthase [Bryobacteraceae bacterium]|jgi:Geranylgeranyl pyrophosphate synthase|nr:farnesyl diphosphate synthase [Bryobacteraceae bacterium]
MTQTEPASLDEYLTEQQQLVDRALDAWLPAENVAPFSIHKAMRYSVFAGGKRIRPILAIAAARAVSDSPDGIENAAATLEMVHTYSLIHDDLPAMDNDDLRRGRPTCHKLFGDALAILGGDALCTLAFEVLSRLRGIGPEQKVRLIEELARASGTVGGMIAGQVHDIEGEGRMPSAPLLEEIHRAKTGALLRASARMGAIYGGATAEELESLSDYGERVGLAFQIVDDILDVEQTSEKLGKTAGKDQAQQKITFPAVFGLERSRQMAEQERLNAHAALRGFDDRADRLRQLADLIVQRQT